MALNKDLLEYYMSENTEIVRNLLIILDSSDAWKELALELQKFRVPVYLNIDLLRRAQSPATALLNELLKRSCTIQTLKDLLRQSRLLDALSLLDKPEPVEILIQPGNNYEKIHVALGEDLRLECVAVGLPPPKYQWYCDNNMLPDCNSSILTLADFREESEGEYCCFISQKMDDYLIQLTSNTVVCSLLEALPEIVKSLPQVLCPKLGSEVKLEVEVLCRSQYKVEWIKENQILDDENDPVLWIKSVEPSDSAIYRCVVRNSAGEVFSDPCNIIVQSEQRRRNRASAKVALLIANSKYDNYAELGTPTEDVILLADKLEKLNFHVITLINLSLHEMRASIEWFFDKTPPKAYAFFCYIGHGFLLSTNKFMMPVDCPKQNEYKMADCIWDQLLIKKAKERKLKLLVTVLDMCLKGPDRHDNPDIFTERHPDYSYEPYYLCSVIQASATSNYQSAYENPNMANGFYIDHISKYLECEKGIVNIFQIAHEEFQRNKVIELQTPSLSFDANTVNFKFTDPIKESSENMDKLVHFIKAKELKVSHDLYFPKIDLHTTVFAMPHRGRVLNAIDIQYSQTIIKQWRASAYISPEDLLTCCWTTSSKDENCTFLTLFNVQKVKRNIYVTTVLYDSEHQEILKADEIDLGLPLIASAKLWLTQI